MVRFLTAHLFLSVLLVLNAGITLAQTPVGPDTKSGSANSSGLARMVFFVAEGEADACGPGCSQWIAAVGPIDSGTASSLRWKLNLLKDRKLPLYFFSRGGNGPAAMEIGRVLRKAGTIGGVGRTIVDGCPTLDERCQELVQSGRPLRAKLDLIGGVCASACVLALAGAEKRHVDPRARIAVHRSISVKVLAPRGNVVEDPNPTLMLQIDRYLRDMGIDHRLYELMASTPNHSIRNLRPDEIERWITTR